MYHCVAETNPPHVRHLYNIRTPKQFESEIDRILKNYHPVSIGELFQSNKSIVHFTFDDGFRSCYEVIMPILLKKGVPATFFINSSTINNKQLMFRCKASLISEMAELEAKSLKITYKNRSELDDLATEMNVIFDDYLKEQQPYLMEDNLKEMVEKGFSIGSHSVDHPYYFEISLEEQIKQTIISQEYVNKFYSKERLFAFPFTDYQVKKNFFDAIMPQYIDMSFGTAGFKDDIIPNHHHRLPMEKFPVLTRYKDFIKFEQVKYILKCMIGKNKIQR